MKKKLLLFVATLLPLLASAYDLVDEKGLFYNIKGDGTLEVVGLDAKTTEADILSDVMISGNEYRVTSIGERAFEGRSDLTYLSIPWSVTSIGEYAFIDCGSNITVNIADPESWCKMELGNEHSSPLSSAGKVLVFDVETTNINIPEGVTSIGNFTFYQCRCITSLTIPSSVRSIGSSAFEDCTGLTSLTLNEGLESIGGSAFEGCTGLKILKIPSTVKTISINAFANCTGITDVYCYAVNVPVTDENAFDGTPTENSTLHVLANAMDTYKTTWPWSDFKNIVEVGGKIGEHINVDGIYYIIGENNTVSVTYGETRYSGHIVIPSNVTYKGKTYSVTSIGMAAFSSSYLRLSSVSIPSSISSLEYEAFSDCNISIHITDLEAWFKIAFSWQWQPWKYSIFLNGKEIKDLIIPGSISSINNYAFRNCTGLSSVTVPNNVTTIGNSAFQWCSGLTSLTIGKSVTSIGSSAFHCCPSLTSIKVESENPNYNSRNNCNAIIDNNNQLIVGCKNTIIPNSVTSIGSSAFYGCTDLTSITIPNNVTSIGSSAFSQCTGLIYIILPKSLTSIGSSAFSYCRNVIDVYCRAENTPSAENNVFPNYENITLHVPSASFEAYRSTEPWSKFKTCIGFDNSDLGATEKCLKPTISTLNGKLVFSCETSGVSYRWSISTPNGLNGSGIPTLPITLNVFATKSGYLNSDVATYEFNGLVGDVDGNGEVNVADHVKLSSIIMDQKE